MSEEEIPLSQHDQLAMAIAQGKSIAGWARQSGAKRTRGANYCHRAPMCAMTEELPQKKNGVLEDRVAELEERFGDRIGHTSRPAWRQRLYRRVRESSRNRCWHWR